MRIYLKADCRQAGFRFGKSFTALLQMNVMRRNEDATKVYCWLQKNILYNTERKFVLKLLHLQTRTIVRKRFGSRSHQYCFNTVVKFFIKHFIGFSSLLQRELMRYDIFYGIALRHFCL
jgi:hypothetical protein